MGYSRRIIDDVIDEIFPHLAAVAIEGAKGVGKTATALRRAATTLSMVNPSERAVVSANLEALPGMPAPIFIDEWQLEPSVWDRVKTAVDDDQTGGRFLLAGSAGVAPGVRVHSGAGRIVRLQMRPMAFSERGIVEPTVSLRALSAGEQDVTGTSDVDLNAYTDEILRSGFPGIRELPESVRWRQLDSYIDRIVDRELPENGVEVRRPTALRSWLEAYGAATATEAGYGAILDAATPGEADKPARQTTALYRDHLQRLFILDPVPAWTAMFTPLKRLTHSPKHHLVDPALAARLVGVGKEGLLRGAARPLAATGPWLGALFESLVTQSIRVYAEAIGARVGHLRTKGGVHEVDLVVESGDRSCVAIEVKLSPTVDDQDVRHLNWLHEQVGDRLTARVVINTGKFAFRRRDGVVVLPLALIGP